MVARRVCFKEIFEHDTRTQHTHTNKTQQDFYSNNTQYEQISTVHTRTVTESSYTSRKTLVDSHNNITTHDIHSGTIIHSKQ